MEQQQLEDLIRIHQEKYYNGEAEITDEEFDALWDELEKKYPDSELLINIGETVWDGFPKAKHIMSMCSQQKAGTISAFEKWASLQNLNFFVAEFKCDGISLSIQYENGKFVKALTRGNGKIGDDISQNVCKMQGFKEEIDFDFTGGVRCEIVMLHNIFNKKYKDVAKNPRNIASGIAKRKDGEGCSDLTLIYYDVQYTNDVGFKDESEKLVFLRTNFSNEFVVYSQECNSIEEVIDFRNNFMKNRHLIPYDIDGIVVKDLEIDEEDLKRSRPKKQIAFKFETEKVETVLLDVEWSESGTYYTPVGILEPIELNGTTVKRASLANLALIKKLDVKIGDIVEVSKRGEIIPKIERVVQSNNGQTPLPPNRCNCGAFLENDGVFLFCPNKNCHKKKLHRLFKWIRKLDVKYFGEVMIKKLYENNLIENISDFYNCDVQKIISIMETIDGFSANNITKAFNNLYKVKEISLSKFIGGYDIDGVGERLIEIVIDNSNNKYNTIESILQENPTTLAEIKQIGEKKATQIILGVRDNFDDMQKTLESNKIKIIEIKKNSNKLNKISFCITGKLNNGKRDDYIKIIKDNGGTYKNGVNNGLSFLVNNDLNSNSSKNNKAKELNIPIISEIEFLKMME